MTPTITFQKRQNYGESKTNSGYQGLWGRDELAKYGGFLG